MYGRKNDVPCKPRPPGPASFLLGLALAYVAGCGDPQLNAATSDRFVVDLPGWHEAYAPKTTALVSFPGIDAVDDPRFESSDPAVVVATFRPEGFRPVRIDARREGEAEISLFDGDSLVRVESVRVVQPGWFALDFSVQNEKAPPAAALVGEEAAAWLTTEVPAVVRYYGSFVQDGAWRRVEVVASGEPTFARDVLFNGESPGYSTEFERLESARLDSGDSVRVLFLNSGAEISLDMSTGRSISFQELPWAYPTDLELIIDTSGGPDRQSIAVYGVDDRDTRVLGLVPEVRLNGEKLVSEASTGLADLPWLFKLPEGVEEGVVEASWEFLKVCAQLRADSDEPVRVVGSECECGVGREVDPSFAVDSRELRCSVLSDTPELPLIVDFAATPVASITEGTNTFLAQFSASVDFETARTLRNDFDLSEVVVTDAAGIALATSGSSVPASQALVGGEFPCTVDLGLTTGPTTLVTPVQEIEFDLDGSGSSSIALADIAFVMIAFGLRGPLSTPGQCYWPDGPPELTFSQNE